jgi:hypothetical protein
MRKIAWKTVKTSKKTMFIITPKTKYGHFADPSHHRPKILRTKVGILRKFLLNSIQTASWFFDKLSEMTDEELGN